MGQCLEGAFHPFVGFTASCSLPRAVVHAILDQMLHRTMDHGDEILFRRGSTWPNRVDRLRMHRYL